MSRLLQQTEETTREILDAVKTIRWKLSENSDAATLASIQPELKRVERAIREWE